MQEGPQQRVHRKIKRNPENYYVNVHNSEYPDGAVRGQFRFED